MPQTHPLPEPLFPRLRSGRGLAPEKATAHRRARLLGAMVEAVRRHGYAETTIAELAGLAGVSKSAFYESFESKQQCFLATFEEIVARASGRIGVAYRSRRGFRERLRAAMEAFAEIVAEEPAASALVVVDSLSLGAAGVGPRERAVEAFELMFRQSFAQAPERGEVSALQVRAIVAGIRRVVYRCLREGRPEQLRDQVEELLDWALSYQRPAGGAPAEAVAAAPAPPGPRRAAKEDSGARPPGWEEPPDSARSRSELSQRERIVRAAALVAADRGYEALTIPAISAAAGVSNVTFYEHFSGKEEAFVAAFDALAKQALRATAAAAAGREDWAEALGAGTRGLLEFTAANRLFARLAFFELPTAGANALDRADATTKRFTAFLAPPAIPAGIEAPADVVVEAIGGGMWAVIQHEIAHGRAEDLPTVAPQLAAIALVPFGVA